MKILVVEPGMMPKRVEIPHTLEAMQKVVGGFIETVHPFDDPVVLICDEEGKLKGKTPNIYIPHKDIIVGTIFICGLGEENLTDLPDTLMEKYETMLKEARALLETPEGIIPIYILNDPDDADEE